jgi:hypothetical protein
MVNMFGKNKDSNPIIQFIGDVDGIEDDELCIPRSAKSAIPQWWYDTPIESNGTPTIKKCPSFPDYFSQGYIIPMWDDITVHFNNNNTAITAHTDKYEQQFDRWQVHPNEQFLNHYSPKIGDRSIEATMKMVIPWNIITPKGYSTMILPLFYNFNEDWTIMPGILDTDIGHQVNTPFLLHSNGKPVNFAKGMPLFVAVPFKRLKPKFKLIKKDPALRQSLDQQYMEYEHMRKDGNPYRKLQKKRDNGL